MLLSQPNTVLGQPYTANQLGLDLGDDFKASTSTRWKVWRDSLREVIFHPLAKALAWSWYHELRRWNQRTGVVGEIGVDIVESLISDFLNELTGRLDPAKASIGKMIDRCERCVSQHLNVLRKLGVVTWKRRCELVQDQDRKWVLVQTTNAYTINPPSQWKGYKPKEKPPAPDPETYKAPVFTSPVDDMVADRRPEVTVAAIYANASTVELEKPDKELTKLEQALAGLARAVRGAKTP